MRLRLLPPSIIRVFQSRSLPVSVIQSMRRHGCRHPCASFSTRRSTSWSSDRDFGGHLCLANLPFFGFDGNLGVQFRFLWIRRSTARRPHSDGRWPRLPGAAELPLASASSARLVSGVGVIARMERDRISTPSVETASGPLQSIQGLGDNCVGTCQRVT